MKSLLESRITATASVLDLGCGLGGGGLERDHHYLCVDAFPPYLEELKDTAHTLQGVLPEILYSFLDRSFDVVLLLDVIEHLDKSSAIGTLLRAKEIARDRVIVYTPEGLIPQEAMDAWGKGLNYYQKHRCGFILEELEELEFTLIKRFPSFSEQAGDHFGLMVEWERTDA